MTSAHAQAYRNDAARYRLPQVLEVRTAELSQVDAARRVVAGQMGRTAGGVAALTTTLVALSVAVLGAAIDDATLAAAGPITLVAALPVGLLVYAVGRAIGQRRTQEELAVWLRPTTDARADIERLEARGPRAVLADMAAHRGVAALALPLSAVALAGPLLLHLVAFVVFGDGDLGDFGGWMALSLVVVGIAHVALVLLACDHARRLQRHIERPFDWLKALGAVTVAATIPGAVLLLIPPVLTFVTGLLVLPAMYGWGTWLRNQEDARLQLVA